MRDGKTSTGKSTSKIQCIEVLISKSSIANSRHNLEWTLSVYSLENHPASKSKSLLNSEIFHFMVYDWKRTIKQLLEDHQIAYSIIQYFTSDAFQTEGLQENPVLSTDDANYLTALNNLEIYESVPGSARGMFTEGSDVRDSALVLDRKDY
jgi:hypothetical protein